jgi:hypothetical protein
LSHIWGRIIAACEFGNSLLPNRFVPVGEIESLRVPQIPPGKTPHIGEFGPQVGGETFHNGVTPTGCLLFFHNRVADVPVEQDQFAVDGPGCGDLGAADTTALFIKLQMFVWRQGL